MKMQDHLEKDIFLGGWNLPYAALKNGVTVMAGATGVKYNEFSQDEFDNCKDHFISMIELNKKEYDQLLIGVDCKVWRFEREYSEFDEQNIWMIEVAVPELKENPDLKIWNSAKKILRVAISRIKKAGFANDCSRCGGTGHYSRNARGETRCYKCGGAKTTLPRLTKKLKTQIEEHFINK